MPLYLDKGPSYGERSIPIRGPPDVASLFHCDPLKGTRFKIDRLIYVCYQFFLRVFIYFEGVLAD